MGKASDNQVFEDEIGFLDEAVRYAVQQSTGSAVEPEFLERYHKICDQYAKLIKVSQTLSRISDTQGKSLKRRQNDIKNLLDNLSQGFLTFGKNMLVHREYSAECRRIFRQKIGGMNILELLGNENSLQNELFAQTFWAVFEQESPEEQSALLAKLPGVIRIFDTYLSIQYKMVCMDVFEGTIDTMMIILTDITEKQKSEDQVLYLSYHDGLTSLHNRTYIESVLPQLQSAENFPFSIVMADMNALKLANDVFGHEAGDKMLVNTAKVLMKCCRKSDIVARWGGDEFLIILPTADARICQRICQQIKETCAQVLPEPIELSLSLGSVTCEKPISNVLELLSIAENEMYNNKISESKKTRQKIVYGLETLMNERFPDNAGHIQRVTGLAMWLAQQEAINLPAQEIDDLKKLTTLHELGKVALPVELLKKQEKITPDEYSILIRYTEIGYRMAQCIDQGMIANALLCLGEKWDGSGYPKGLQGESIPRIARIVALADAFDVMTHGGPHKNKLTLLAAIEEIKACSGSQFDPDLVALFLAGREMAAN